MDSTPPALPPQPRRPGTRRPGADAHRSEATRLLCLGAHLNAAFRRRVVEELLDHPERPVAPSLGVDVLPVLAHALRARAREVRTGLLLLALWPVLVLVDHAGWQIAVRTGTYWPSALRLGMWSAYYALVCLGLWAARTLTAAPGTRRGPDGRRLRRARFWTLLARLNHVLYWVAALGWLPVHVVAGVPLPAWLPWLGGWEVPLLVLPAVDTWFGDPQAEAPLLGAPEWWLPEWAPAALVPPAALLLCTLWQRGQLLGTLRHELSREAFPLLPRRMPDVGPAHRRTVAAINREQHSPLTSYDPFRPFAGAGRLHEPWSFAVELRRRKPGGGGGRLTSRQVVDLIRPQLERLARESAATSRDRLKDLELQECVFLPAGDRRDGADHSPDAIAEQVAEAVDEGAETRRYFLRVRIGAWDEQLVITVLVRIHTQGGMLVLEVVPHVLPPIREDFRTADALLAADASTGGPREALAFLAAAPAAGAEAVLSALREAAAVPRRWLRPRGNPLPEGPLASVRELGSEPTVSLFQKMDASRYVKTVQDRIVNGVRTALKSQGYEVDEFDRQVVNVAAGGVFIGGSMSGGAIASGSGSKAEHAGAHPARGRRRDHDEP
ncbi:hypothetical protein [Streptomyces thermolineatus]|uniref:hypothetical protein n=1 Tax=Streptomyces thermolineatus TaxID=44033 RepID=UPI00384E1DA9